MISHVLLSLRKGLYITEGLERINWALITLVLYKSHRTSVQKSNIQETINMPVQYRVTKIPAEFDEVKLQKCEMPRAKAGYVVISMCKQRNN